MADTVLDYVHGERQEPQSESAFDVVFVHGLGGDGKSTWTNGNGDCWSGWVAEDFPSLNVYSAGYDSGVLKSVFSGAGATFRDQASMLLDRLSNRKSSGRPTFFITHSLGGLVVKQMLRRSEDALRERQQRIARQSLGAAFIATPHQGANFANSVRAVFHAILSAAAVELEHGSESLLELAQWFSKWAAARGIRVECYYETLKTNGVLVVDKITADAHVLGCDPIAVAADHVSIVKPPSRDAQLYCSIKGVILDLLDGLQSDDGGGFSDQQAELDAFTSVASSDRRTLAEKLHAVGRGHEVARAEMRKEQFSKSIQRNIALPSAVAAYAELMTNIEMRFHQHIGPLIQVGECEANINQAVMNKVIEPSLVASREQGAKLSIGVVESAMYYLAGNCHLGWDNV